MGTEEQQVAFLQVDGRRIAWASVGGGPLLVLPAWWVSHLVEDWRGDAFRRFVETLARRYRVVRYDRPAAGSPTVRGRRRRRRSSTRCACRRAGCRGRCPGSDRRPRTRSRPRTLAQLASVGPASHVLVAYANSRALALLRRVLGGATRRVEDGEVLVAASL